jgi:hypothetical protein
MSVRVAVVEGGDRIIVGISPGVDTDLFSAQGDHTTRFSFRIDVAPWLEDLYKQWRSAFHADWSVHVVWINRKYDLQDHLVRCFDDAVDWPDYQWGLQNLRARRDRLRRRAGTEYAPVNRYPAPVTSAYAVLNCPVGSDLAKVNKVYREASHRHHPDKGGSASMMAGLNRAIGILRAYLSNNAPQPASSTS